MVFLKLVKKVYITGKKQLQTPAEIRYFRTLKKLREDEFISVR